MNEVLNWNYRLVRYFLKNKQLNLLLLVIIIFGGLYAFSRFRVEGFPEIEVPFVIVNTVVPGAGPETVDTLVTTPIESKIKDVKGVKDISSTSATGFSNIFVQFEDGINTSSAAQEVRTKISSVNLPETSKEPDVIVPDTGNPPFILAVTGQKSLQELLISSKIYKEELLNVAGVASVTQMGGLAENIYINIPKDILNENLIAQIRGSATGFPLGQAVINNKLIPISANSQVKSLDDLSNIRVSLQTPDGLQNKRLGDIATIYRGLDAGGEINRIGFRDGDIFRIQSGILFIVRLDKNADVIDSGARVEDAVQKANNKQQGVLGVLVSNQAEYSKQQLNEIVEGAFGGKWNFGGALGGLGYAFGGVWLLVLVMLLFLDWRSALVSIISIPLSFLTTFLALQIMGVQLNTIVLFSMVLVLGLIVDPAIVILESIKRYMEIGYKGTDAVLRSISVIGSGIFMAVLTSLIVFVPFGVVGGTFGSIIKYIPLTVIPALIASYFVPMVFLTWLGGKFLKANKRSELQNENDPHTLWSIAQWFIRANKYILASGWLSVLVIILGLLVPIGVASFFIATGKIKQVQFAGSSDSDLLAITAPLPENITNGGRGAENSKLETILKNYAGVIKHYYYGSIDGSGSTAKSLNIIVELVPGKEREQKSPEIAKQLTMDLKEIFGDEAFVQELSAGPPEESYPVTIKIFDTDNQAVITASKRIAEQMTNYPEVTGVKYDGEKQSKNVSVAVIPEKAFAVGLTPQNVYGQIAKIFITQTIFALDGVDVIVKADGDDLLSANKSLQDMEIFGPQGRILLRNIASIEEVSLPSSIHHSNGNAFGQVSARVREAKDIIAVQRNITQWAKDNAEIMGLSATAFEEKGGAGNDFEKSFQQLFLAIALSIIITYVFFVLFFRSFIQPLIILFSVPLLAVGVFPALVIFANGQLGFLEILGVIMVIGIVENVGIFLIDFANRKVSEGMDKREAISLSSGIRFRAIILTKLTALAGLLPLAVFAPFWRGLAVVVIAGIISSGILSLFTTPVLYYWFTKNKKIQEEDKL